jgi:polysaccharide biosynthesis transport protein
MQGVPQNQTSLREIDFSHYFRHYISLLWRWKWWIIGSTPIAAGLAVIVFFRLSMAVPEVSANVTIGMEPIAGMITIGGAQAAVPNNEENSQTELIKSRNFLQNIVTKLSLQLRVVQFARSTIFDSVVVDSFAQSGAYLFSIDKKNGNKFSFYKRKNFFGKEVIASGNLSELTSIDLPGVWLHFSKSFRQNPHTFKFGIAEIRSSVEQLFGKVSITFPQSRSDRTPTFIISVSGKDYPLITETVNTIADKFVEKNLSLRQARSQSMLSILEMQLEKTKADLAKSEDRLKAFRTANPTVGLSQTAEHTVASLLETERNSSTLVYDVESARKLQSKLGASSFQDAIDAARTALLFLNSKNNTASPILNADLVRLAGERRNLLNTYDSSHPLVVQNQTAMTEIISKTTTELVNYIAALENQQTTRTSEITNLSQRMKSLPVKELELADLLRQQQANTDIYSKVLEKYNQAKVSDVVEVSDVYVMDYAVVPFAPPSNKMKPIGICFLIFLLIVLLPMIGYDLITKTVRTEFDLKKILPFPVLECIPLIVPKNKVSALSGVGEKNSSGQLGKNLIINEFVPKKEYIKELFRSLRTKILLRIQANRDKSILITSLEAGSGKSTITSNIAIALAQQNIKTLIIDCDLRLGTIHDIFNIKKTPGLSEFLASVPYAVTKESVLAVVRPTVIPNLSIVPSGRYADNAAELLSSERFRQVKNHLSDKFDVILCDSPPIGVAADAMSISDSFEHFLIIVRAGQTNVVDLKKKINEYSQLGSKILGIVLNFAAADTRLKYYKYSKYYK